jgi:hypothetical protein
MTMPNRDLVLKELHAATEAIAAGREAPHLQEQQAFTQLSQAHALTAIGYLLMDIEFHLRDLDRLAGAIEEHL